ncbi:MAG: hypothetical protein IPM64_02185 [Phycisphaerales bacterium]|nr:hypothetical protein [Phycisphaerales bacterium]
MLGLILLVVPTANTAEPTAEEARLAPLLARYEEQQRRLLELERSMQTGDDVELERTRSLRAQIRDILADAEFREALMPPTLTAGYDNGFYLRSTDGAFAFRFNGFLMFRYTHLGTRQENRYVDPRLRRSDRSGFDITRLRMTFSGHAFSKDMTYSITIRSDGAQRNNTALHMGWIEYAFDDALHVRLGRFRLANLRQQVISDSRLQFADRGLVDAVFGLNFGTGVSFLGKLADGRLRYAVDVVNSVDGPNNRVITNDPSQLDGNPALVARAAWRVLGEDADLGSYEGDDRLREDPGLELAAHYAFNQDDGDRGTARIPFNRSGLFPFFRSGGFGLASMNGTRFHQIGVDAVFKWRGFSLQGEYVARFLDIRAAWDNPAAPLWRLTGEESTTAMHGAYVQTGCFLPIPGHEKRLEAVARVGGVRTNVGGGEGAWEYAAGFNYHFHGQKAKIVTDVTKITEAPISSPTAGMPNVNDDVLMWRVQYQVNF